MDFIFLAGTFIRHLSGSQFWNNQVGYLYTGELRKAVEKPERICPAHRPGKSRRLEVSRDAGTDGTVQPERPVTYTGFATIIQRTRPTGFTQQPVSLCAIGGKYLFPASGNCPHRTMESTLRTAHQRMAGNCGRAGCLMFTGYLCLQSSAIHLPGTDRKAFLLSGHTNGASPYASFPMREKRCHHSVSSVFPDYYRSQYGREKHLPENYRRELPAGLRRNSCMLRETQASPKSAHYQPAHL